MAIGFFRDVSLPSHRDDRIAHERFLLDTYADRRDVEATPPAYAAVVKRILHALGRRSES